MKKLSEGDVERLLTGAADWEPTAPPPPMVLPELRARRGFRPLYRIAGLGSLAVAVCITGWQLAPKPTAVPLPTRVVATELTFDAAPGKSPSETSAPPPVRLASAPPTDSDAPKRPRQIVRREARGSEDDESEVVRRRPRRKRNWIGERKSEPIRQNEEYAPDRYVLSSQPLPKDAVTLDDTHRVVPVVVTDRDEKTGELRLIPAATIVSNSAESNYSLE